MDHRIEESGSKRSLLSLRRLKWRNLWPIISTVIVVIAAVISLYQFFQYKTFSSNIDEINFTFKYPRTWHKPSISRSDVKYTVTLQGPFELSISVYHEKPSQPLEEATSKVNDYIEGYSNNKNFSLFANSILSQGQYSGPRATFTYDAATDETTGGEVKYIPSRFLVWIFPYNGKLYEIIISGSSSSQDEKWKDIGHFFDTFQIK